MGAKMQVSLIDKAHTYLTKLCTEIPSRRVGSEGNRTATDFFSTTVTSFGFAPDCQRFDCIDWREEGARLVVGDAPFAVYPSPYSLGCERRAPLRVVTTVEELESAEIAGEVVLLRGEIAAEQLMPKNFPFYNPDNHRQIVALLESKRPAAIVAATARNPELAGAVYPFPLIEDGDFDLPSVYTSEEEGLRLSQRVGSEVELTSRAWRIPSHGYNVVARRQSEASRRVGLFAHIDAKLGTPGASDNASGVVVLLLLAELLADYSGMLGIELLAMNGEDYYACPGEIQYLAQNAGKMGDILLGINLDDIGYRNGKVAYSLYGCPADTEGTIRSTFSRYEGLMEGEPWYQGDHGLFIVNEVPALALTSENLVELMANITHSPQDTPEVVDVAKLVETAQALGDLLVRLDREVA
jgi:aminopeptidase YwaD